MHNNALQERDKIIQNLDLGDTCIWRDLNPESKRFTRRRKPNIRCRLDFLLISNCLYSNVILKTEINLGYKTDHSILITLSLTTHANNRGPGL